MSEAAAHPHEGVRRASPRVSPRLLRRLTTAEWIKVRSIPDTYAYLVAAVVLGGGWALAPTVLDRSAFIAEITRQGTAATLGPMFWLGVTRLTIVVVMVLGAMIITGERESGTAIVTRAAVPHPLAVYAIKVGLGGVLGAVAGFVTGLAVPLAVRIPLGPVAAPFTTEPALFLGYGVRVAVITALAAMAGVALGALTRSLLVAAVIAFVWVWFENMAASMLGDLGNLFVMTPWRNLSYFIDRNGYELPYLWSSNWGFAPLAVITILLLLAGALRHRDDTDTIKE